MQVLQNYLEGLSKEEALEINAALSVRERMEIMLRLYPHNLLSGDEIRTYVGYGQESLAAEMGLLEKYHLVEKILIDNGKKIHKYRLTNRGYIIMVCIDAELRAKKMPSWEPKEISLEKLFNK